MLFRSWVLVPTVIHVPYGVHLAGRLIVFAAFLAVGARRLWPRRADVRGVDLGPPAPAPAPAEVAAQGSR